MMLDDETLIAFADGEAEDAREIQAALTSRPHLARRVKEMRALRKSVAGAYAPIAQEAPPAHLLALIGAPAIVAPRQHMISIGAAASLAAAGVAVGVGLVSVFTQAPSFMQAPSVAPSASPPTVAEKVPLILAPKPRSVPLIVDRAPGAVAITNPTWLKRPNGRDFERYFPERALEREKNGRVVLACTIAANGSIDCTVASEDPEGWGFGDAAIKMSKLFQIAPMTVNGQATAGGKINVPITFKLGN